MAGEVPLATPWTAPKAREWDGQTLETWKLANMTTDEGRLLLDLGIEAVFAGEPRDVSLLHVLFYIHSAGSFENLINTEGGAQESRFVGGSQTVSKRVAAALGHRVLLDTPVRRIVQGRRGVTVESDRAVVARALLRGHRAAGAGGAHPVRPHPSRGARPAHAADADGLGAQGPCPLRPPVLARRRAHRPGHQRHRPGEGHLRQLAPDGGHRGADRLHRGRGGPEVGPAPAAPSAARR